MNPTPRYAEHAPPPALDSLVECFWTTRGSYQPGRSHLHRVLPDGCMDVIVDRAAGGAVVVGTMTRALEIRQAGTVDLLGVRFRPGAAPAFLQLPADACVDERVDLSRVWPRETPRLVDALLREPDPAGRLRVLGAALQARESGCHLDALVMAASRRLTRRHPPSVNELADDLGVGRRTLERRFRSAVGLSPWHLARVARLRRAVARLSTQPDDLSRAAHAAGFHDQPHMNRDFREMVGVPPGVWLAERRPVASVQDTAGPEPHRPQLSPFPIHPVPP